MKHRIVRALTLLGITAGGLSCTEPSAEERALAKVSVVHVDRPAAGKPFFAGSSEWLTASAFDSAGVLMTAPLSFRWESSDSTSISVEQDGRITAKRPGGAWIYARLPNGIYGFLSMGVQDPALVYTLNPDSSRMLPGQRKTLALQFLHAPTVVPVQGWSSSNTAVATVNDSGVVTAVAPGQTTVSTTYANTSFRSEVYVAAISTPMRFASIAAGGSVTCGLTIDGIAHCWGSPNGGALGSTDRIDRCVKYNYYQWPAHSPPPGGEYVRYVTSCAMEPVQVETSLRFASLDIRSATVCGLTGTSEAYCWGATGDLTGSVSGPAVVPVSAQLRFTSFAFPCGVTGSNEGWCFGDPALRGTPASASAAPTQVVGGAIWSYITGGTGNGVKHRCGLTNSGVVQCWGSNTRGKLGTGDTTASPLPVPVQSAERFSAVAVNADESCALSLTQQLYCWGNGLLTPTVVPTTLRFTALSTSGSMCVLATDGVSHCRYYDGTMPSDGAGVQFRSMPVGASHRCGIRQDGITVCWGRNVEAQLGNGDNIEFKPRPTPVVGQ